MVNKDSAHSKFDTMMQGDTSMAKYFIELREQADKCQFKDMNDTIHMKILQTMKDERLGMEAMLKSYTPINLLKQAAKKGHGEAGKGDGKGQGQIR